MEAFIHSLSHFFSFILHQCSGGSYNRQTDSYKPSPSSPRPPAVKAPRRGMRAGVTLTVGLQEKHLTLNRHGAGSPVPQPQLPTTSLTGWAGALRTMADQRSALRASRRRCCTRPASGIRGLGVTLLHRGGVFCRRSERSFSGAFLTLEMQNSLARTKG